MIQGRWFPTHALTRDSKLVIAVAAGGPESLLYAGMGLEAARNSPVDRAVEEDRRIEAVQEVSEVVKADDIPS